MGKEEAYQLVPKEEFTGEVRIYKVPAGREYEEYYESLRNDPNGFYHGMMVKHKGKEWVLVGPEVTFVNKGDSMEITETQLIHIDAFTQALAEAKTIPEVKELADKASLFRQWLKKQKAGWDALNAGLEMKLMAERKLGEMLREQIRHEGGNPQLLHYATVTLSQLGIERTASHRWQRLSEIPEEHLVRYITECGEREELTTAGFLRFHLKILREGVESPPLPKGLFTVIYADPPWEFEFYQDSHRAIVMNYDPMTLQQICEMEIPSDSDAILFLWTPNPKVEEALQVVGAWGFNYRTNMAWVKDRFGMGYFVRNQHELLLIARRGKLPPPDEENRVSSVIDERRLEHSRKPGKVYEIIEKMYPNQRYIELFARQKRPGWESWGLELNGQVRKG